MANVIFAVARLLSASALCVQRQVSISDLGHDDDWRGWYDLRGCGEGQCWDYCRWVGSNGSQGDPRLTTGSAHNNSSKWTCVLANETDVDTVWDRWGTVWPTGLYSTRCPSQGAQAPTYAPTDVPTDAARRAQATQEAPTLAPTPVPTETPTLVPTETPTLACGALENNAGTALPNMPLQTNSSCDCKLRCDAEPLCKGWTYSAGMYTDAGKNCWLRQTWTVATNDCGADCLSAQKACGALENNAGTPLPNMPIATNSSCDCKQKCRQETLCKAWTYSAGMGTISGKNCWLREEWVGLLDDCGGDCRSGSKAPPTLAPTPLPTETPTPAPPSLAPTPLPTETPTPAPPSLAPTPLPTKTPTPAPPTLAPTRLPTKTPTPAPPTLAPTPLPTKTPTPAPSTLAPTPLPTKTPTPAPPTLASTPLPTKTPTPAPPTLAPTPLPTKTPTLAPTLAPTPLPTETPTRAPTLSPTPLPAATPTRAPTLAPTPLPAETPTLAATTVAPTPLPTETPTRAAPTVAFTPLPTETPTPAAPTVAPTPLPTETPTPAAPQVPPTPLPTETPTPAPTDASTAVPTDAPTVAQACGALENNAGATLPNMPFQTISSCDCKQRCDAEPLCKGWTYSAGMHTESGKNCWLRQEWAGALYDCGADCQSGPKAPPTLAPTPTKTPTPAAPTLAPTPLPTETPTPAAPTVAPTPLPTETPTPALPTLAPTPTKTPTPAAPTVAPTPLPTETPTPAPPTLGPTPTKTPTPAPFTLGPTPTKTPTPAPTAASTVVLTDTPIVAQAAPTSAPTPLPTETPTPALPAASTVVPTDAPMVAQAPTQSPTQEPTESPTAVLTFTPTQKPRGSPTAVPTVSPTAVPTQKPTQKPTESPTAVPTCTPTHQPTESPTKGRTQKPTREPTGSPTAVPTQMPTQMQTREPTALPTALPTFTPTHRPKKLPTSTPSLAPTPTNTSNGEPLLLQHFLDALAEDRMAQIRDFIASNETKAVSKIGDTVMVVQKLSLTEAVGGMVPVKSEGGTEVAVPTSLVERLGGEVIFAVAEFKEDTFPFAGYDSTQTSVARPTVRVTGVVDLGIADPKTGEKVVVENLDPPLIFTLGVNRTDQTVCAFFDEVLQKWSTEGISLEQSSVGSKLRCATTHLSFFGSILEGMLKTLACSNFSLLTSLGYADFPFTDWCSDIGALLLWIFLGLILVLFVITIALDYYRYHSPHGWRDEYFLFPGEGPEMHVLDDDSTSRTVQTHGCCLAIIGVVICSVGSFLLEPVVEIVQEMIADMLGDFWYIYITVKNIFSTMAGMGQCSTATVIALLIHFSESLSCSSALRAAGGLTWRDVEDMELVNEGLELFEATMVRRHDGAYVESEVEFTMKIDAERSNEEVSFRENAHYNHITKRLAHFDGRVSSTARRHSKNKSSRTYCLMIAMIFLNEIPVFRIFFQSIGTPSSMRFLYFMSDISGMLMLTTMFASAGTIRSRRSTDQTQSDDVDSVDPCEIQNFEEQLGRVIVIGIAAAVLCVVPKTIISKMRSRKFRLIGNIGSSAWKKQLRVWRCRDILTWILGIGYILWCVNISFIYVISVVPDDQFEWFASIVTSVAEDGLVIPAVLAVSLPAIVRIFSMVLELSRLRVLADSSDEIEEGQRSGDSSGEIVDLDAELGVACSEKKLQDPQEHEAAQHVNTASGVGPVRDVDTAVEVIAMDRDNALMQDGRRFVI